MKKSILILFFFISGATLSNAQGFRLGAKAGANLNQLSGVSFDNGFNLAYHFGAFMEIDFNKKWGVQPELLWNQSSGKPSSFQAIYTGVPLSGAYNPETVIKLDYLSIPLLLRYNIGSMLTLNAGPQYSILINKEKNLLQNGESAFKTGDFAMVAGAQLNFKYLRVYGRYNIGLSNINDIDNKDSWTSQQIQFGLGFRF
ncbi:MAG: hypothetical protein RLZZ28_2346 [Bacteroidota bacterium]|jgi:hypothetical protein